MFRASAAGHTIQNDYCTVDLSKGECEFMAEVYRLRQVRHFRSVEQW